MYVYLRVYVQHRIGVVGTLIGESCHTYTCHVAHTRVMQHPLYAHTRIPSAQHLFFSFLRPRYTHGF